MLVTMNEMLQDARQRKYGVGMFNTFTVEMAKGVIEAAEELKAPVIIGSAEVLLPCAPIEMIVDMVGGLAKRASVPVALHLDHGSTPSLLRKCVESGFTSIMYDLSETPYEQNVAQVAEMAAFAHKHGASIEGELGHVVFDNPEDTGYAYTRPEEVVDYVERTKVDALAIAIGTAHGFYKEPPVLDLQRLREIRKVTDVGLVLHGGSGLSDDDFRNVVRDGIQKVNIYTDVSYAVTKAAHDCFESKSWRAEDVSVEMCKAAREAAMKKLVLFNCADKA